MGPYGPKRAKLISQAKKNSGILFEYTGIFALLLPTTCVNLRKIELGGKVSQYP